MSKEIELELRPSGLRCALCHDLASGKVRSCPECGVVVHPDCAGEFPECPTLGCEAVFGPRKRGPWLRILGPGVLVVVGFGVMTTPHGGVGVALAGIGALGLAALNVLRLPPSAGQQRRLGEIYSSRSQGARALRCFDRALALEPDDPATLKSRGRLLLELDRPREAIACFDRVVAHDPEDAWALCERAVCWRSLYDDARAEADFSRAEDLTLASLEVDQGDAYAWELLACTRRDRDCAGALAAVEAGLRVSTDTTRLDYQRAEFQFWAGAYELAERSVTRALSEDDLPAVYRSHAALLRARIRTQLDDTAGALEDLEIALEALNPWTRYAGAMVLAACGESAKAAALLRQSVPAAAPDPYVFICLSCLGFEAPAPVELGPKQWPRPLVDYLAGRISACELLELARAFHPGRQATRGHQQEALWCLAARAELAGDSLEAVRRYQEVMQLEHAGLLDWEYARVRLRSLEGDWPST